MIVFLVGATACSETDGADPMTPSTVDRQTEADSAQTWLKERAECLTDAGFPSTYDPVDQSISISKGSGQDAEFAAADAACSTELGGPPTFAPLTEAEIEFLYAESVEAYECLVAEGFDPVPPTTLEQFKATYSTGPWFPHQDATSGGGLPDDVCPQPSLVDP